MKLLAILQIISLSFPYLVLAKSDGYKAVVVEYHSNVYGNLNPSEVLEGNVGAYAKIIKSVTDQHKDVDIVVFPESTLTSKSRMNSRDRWLNYTVEIQDVPSHISICDHPPQGTEKFYVDLACAAKRFNTYVVVNLKERAPCRGLECASNGWDFYNTNVVFSRNGSFVAKYRKFNLFGEVGFNQTKTPDLTIFDTDFGVRFGTFTCFDIMFGKPAVQLVREYGIKHIIFPSMWFSEMPFLTALQAQNQWAYEMNVTMLASGANNRAYGSGGSGIYRGRFDPQAIDVVGEDISGVYVSYVSNKETSIKSSLNQNTAAIDTLAKKLDSFYLKRDKLEPYASTLIDVSTSKIEKTVCSGTGVEELCCQFNIKLNVNKTILNDNNDHYLYRLVAFSGVRSFDGVYNGGVEICGIVACSGDTIETCGVRFKNYDSVSWPVTFERVSIVANYTESQDKVQYPNSLVSNLRPLSTNAFTWNVRSFQQEKIIERSYQLVEPQNRLMTFAIYGRDFSRDSPPQ